MSKEDVSLLAIIPARGGSKSISRKNIAPLAGRPLIAWTIEAAQASLLVDRVVVSTDDVEIAEVAQNYGAEVPFIRPPELAQDDTPGIDPVLHGIQWLAENQGYEPDYVVLLQPTSPLRTSEDIEQAMKLASSQRADSVLSVTPVAHHPYRMKLLDTEGRIKDFRRAPQRGIQRQNLPPVYGLNGAIYLVKRRPFLQHRTWFGARTYAYVMEQERSLDIDTPWDLRLAELILKDNQNQPSLTD